MAVQGKELAAAGKAGGRVIPLEERAAAPGDPGARALRAVASARCPTSRRCRCGTAGGTTLANTRFQNAKSAGLSGADVPKLTLKWAFGFASTTSASGQPTIAGGRVFVGNNNGDLLFARSEDGLHLLDLQGRRRHPHGAQRRARCRSTVRRVHVVMFGDLRANVYGLDAADRRAAVEDQSRRSRDGAHHRRADVSQRPSVRAGVIDRRSAWRPTRNIRAARSAAASSRSTPRPASSSGRPT